MADHAAESGLEVPPEPVIFMKATSAIAGPNDDVAIPRGSTQTDWEVELGVVIGAPAKYVSEERALEHVAGYCVINDYSEREYQIHRAGQWVKGKSADGFGPIGPWLVTADEVPDPQNPASVAGGRRLPLPGRHHRDHGLWSRSCGELSQPFHESARRATSSPPERLRGSAWGRSRSRSTCARAMWWRLGIDGLGEQQQRLVQD